MEIESIGSPILEFSPEATTSQSSNSQAGVAVLRPLALLVTVAMTTAVFLCTDLRNIKGKLVVVMIDGCSSIRGRSSMVVVRFEGGHPWL